MLIQGAGNHRNRILVSNGPVSRDCLSLPRSASGRCSRSSPQRLTRNNGVFRGVTLIKEMLMRESTSISHINSMLTSRSRSARSSFQLSDRPDPAWPSRDAQGRRHGIDSRARDRYGLCSLRLPRERPCRSPMLLVRPSSSYLTPPLTQRPERRTTFRSTTSSPLRLSSTSCSEIGRAHV